MSDTVSTREAVWILRICLSTETDDATREQIKAAIVLLEARL